MTAERMPHDHSQQLFQGQGTEVYPDEDRLLHHTNNAQRLGAAALIGVDPFMVAHKVHSTQPNPASLEADRQAIIKNAIQGRTIELTSPTQESIFYFNPNEDAETPELA